MPHVLSPEATQHHLLSKFDRQMLHAFRSEGSDVKFLKQVYGSDSIIYKNAKNAADTYGTITFFLNYLYDNYLIYTNIF